MAIDEREGEDRQNVDLGAVMAPAEGDFQGQQRMSADLKKAARLLGRRGIRYMVGQYYTMQECRMRIDRQIATLQERGDPALVMSWSASNYRAFENDFKRAMKAFTDEYTVTRWCKSIMGIAEVISSGLVAYLDIRRAPTVGHFWRLAGMDITCKWPSSTDVKEFLKTTREAMANREIGAVQEAMAETLEGEAVETGSDEVPYELVLAVCKQYGRNPELFYNRLKQVGEEYEKGEVTEIKPLTTKRLISETCKRPWIADLKSLLLFKLGECFVKVKARPNDIYGKYYTQRKEYELEMNERRMYKAQAEESLPHFKKTSASYKYYADGRLPPGRLHARARRYAVKLFTSHLHTVMFQDYYGMDKQPPVPYIIAHGEGKHAHLIPVPNWPMAPEETGKSLREFAE